jgi:ATP-binding cassette subfamily B protein
MRYPWLPVVFVVTVLGMAVTQSAAAVFIGQAFDTLVNGGNRTQLAAAAGRVVAAWLGYGACDIVNSLVIRILGQRVERDAREELYGSLLGKSQTFHSRQRVGDLMARATNDMQQLNLMIAPSAGHILESMLTLVVPLITIALLRVDLLLVPTIFLICFFIALQRYNNALRPLAGGLREQFGVVNAGLAEAIGGIEVVKGFAQERAEEQRFRINARSYRDWFVREGRTQARYLPLLIYGVAVGLAFGHALFLSRQGVIGLGDVIAYMILVETLRSPTAFSSTTFSVVQLGLASAERILTMIKSETELDENAHGYQAPIKGEIAFEHVSFGYEDAGGVQQFSSDRPRALALRDITFRAAPGETVAIVGQTGAGKTTLTKLVNRTFDVAAGRVCIDGVDVREWSLDSLRAQIATIEQDIFLFSRSIADNIAFGARGPVTPEQIEEAARLAQAHEFITQLSDGYDTVVGERGVTLSGGQRQRIAIARAFLTDPRILILDDSTSAIDSNTEDQIQRAMQQILRGRTTLLITHRLSQIRRADRILLLKNGTVIAQGTHGELLATSELYRNIFGRDERRVATHEQQV